jgi:hydroxypyruvate isomerase
MPDEPHDVSRRALLGRLAVAAGGVPGRHEINDSQELNYHAIAAAIADLHFQGYVAHEFVPTRPDPFASLAEAFRVCTV